MIKSTYCKRTCVWFPTYTLDGSQPSITLARVTDAFGVFRHLYSYIHTHTVSLNCDDDMCPLCRHLYSYTHTHTYTVSLNCDDGMCPLCSQVGVTGLEIP